MVKIKIINCTEPHMNGKILHLERLQEAIFKCKKSNLEIIDTWGELEILEEYSKKYNSNQFYDMHIFYETKDGLIFIEEIKFLK